MADHLTGQSALQAYRDDIPLGGSVPTANDGDAILVASLVRQSLIVDVEDPMGVRLRSEATQLARASLGVEALAVGCSYDDWPATSDIDVLRLLAQRTEHAGWLNLAQHVLESLASLPAEPVARGLVLADRSRLARKRGQLDLSAAQGKALLRLGKEQQSPILVARGHIALGSLAQVRGNLVEFRERALKTIRVGKAAGLRRTRASAHEGLGSYHGMQGAYNDAVKELWTAFQLADGSPILTTAALGNLAQTLLMAGHIEDARRMWRISLSKPLHLHQMLPALGGYAIASAHLEDVEAVTWACQQVRRLARSRHYPREIAGALMECAIALGQIGQSAPADVLRRRAEGLAITYGFHDLTFRESVVAGGVLPAGRQRFTGSAARAKAEIEQMEVPALPVDVQLAAV